MNVTRLTLISHARTPAQKLGRFADDDAIEAVDPSTLSALLTAVGAYQGVLCGPELRTRQTAALLGGEVTVEAALRDCDMSAWRGLSVKTLQAQEPEALASWLGNSSAAPHGGESMEAVCQRVGQWLEGFQAPGHWLVVTHPFVIRAALLQVLDCPPASGNQVDVAPLSRLELSHYGRWRLRLSGPQ